MTKIVVGEDEFSIIYIYLVVNRRKSTKQKN